MKIITNIENHDFAPSVATIGFFDGMHCGHRYLIHQVVSLARERGLDSLLISFDRHPRQVMQTDFRPLLLSPLEEKCSLLEQSEADHAVLLHFDLNLAALSARDFMRDVLKERLQVQVLLIGYDHHFGHGACDTFEDYVRYGRELGMEVVQASEFQDEGHHVSSSVIRKALLSGDLDFATHALERYYSLSGTVVHGYHLGTSLGFPTANIAVSSPEKLIPAHGVYAVWADLDNGQSYPGMLNIGVRPTMENGDNLSIEVHLLGFKDDLYEKRLTVRFVKFLRAERKFGSKEELVAQLQKDRLFVEQFLKR